MGTIRAQSCAVCHVEITRKLSRPESNYLWGYLYHQNVRESVEAGVGAIDGSATVPKLTFTFSIMGNPNKKERASESPLDLCDKCSLELEKLDKLHQELEGVKKKIEAQVRRINHQRSNSKHGESGVVIEGFQKPALHMSMGGSVIGHENISKALQFLDNLCSGMPSSHQTETITPTLKPNVTVTTTREEVDNNPIGDSMEFSEMDMEGPAIKVETGDTESVPRVLHYIPPGPDDMSGAYEDACQGQPPVDESYLFLDPVGTDDLEENSPEADTVDQLVEPLSNSSSGSSQATQRVHKKGWKKKRWDPDTKCPRCNKTFTKYDCYYQHVIVRDSCHKTLAKKKDELSCHLCSNRFSWRQSLNLHLKSIHGLTLTKKQLDKRKRSK